jgi:hypothetical protein
MEREQIDAVFIEKRNINCGFRPLALPRSLRR